MNAAELKSRIANLPPVEGQTYWDYKRREFRRNLAELDINNFLNWPAIGITMHLGAWPWLAHEYHAVVMEHADWYQALVEDNFGGIEFYEVVDPVTSPNLIHMAYHLLQWEKATGLRVAELKSIVEFGGGFGSMAKLVHRLGFRGKYYIFDFPEFAALQEYYLTSLVPDMKVQWIHRLTPAKTDLWLATWSFSEVPVADREAVINQTQAESYLIGYQDVFEWGDNVAWFEEWRQSKPGYRWITQPLSHQDGNHFYLFGVREGK